MRIKGDLFTTPARPYGEVTEEDDTGNPEERSMDLLIPIICLDQSAVSSE